jgi:flagellar capping protein FliD
MTLADRQFQTLIDSQNDRIERIDDRIEAKRTRLQRQFAAMEEALAKLQTQQSSLGAISQNIAMAGALIG